MGDLKSFFEPKSIAIVGASDNEKKVGGILLKKAVTSSIKIFPVNPNKTVLNGLKTYRSVLDIGERVDLAVIAVPSGSVLNIFKECGRKGIKSIILITAGFSERGNNYEVEKLLEVSKQYGIRFTGANSFGICNPLRDLDLTFAKSFSTKGDIAFISQSGALWSYISDLSRKKKYGFSKFVSLGNMEDLEFSDFIEYFSKDRTVKKIVLYIEKLKDGKRFMKACKKAISKKKEVIVLKGGSSAVGGKAAISHTASLASDYAVYRGVFNQIGIKLAESFSELFGKKTQRKNTSIFGKKAFIITNAGGAGVLVSDYLSKQRVSIVDEPLDIFGTALSSEYYSSFLKIRYKDFDSLVIILTPQSMTEIEKTALEVVRMQELLKKKRVIPMFLGGDVMKEANKIFKKNNISFMNLLQ